MQSSCFFGQHRSEEKGSQLWGPIEFHPKSYYGDENSFPNCWKTGYDNGLTCEGTPQWQEMIDTAIVYYYSYLSQDDRDQYIWGYNLLVENPALSRLSNTANPWHGVWKAAERVLEPFRDTTDAIYNEHPMIVAKGAFYPMHRAGYNIFETLPDIDIFLIHNGAPPIHWNYGEQKIFDHTLYCTEWDNLVNPWTPYRHFDNYNGIHAEAIYFQKYGNTNLAYPEQERRWMAGFWMEWRVEKSDDPQNPSKGKSRRPCPPEIRCLTYLNLSRGAKGIFFVCWSGPTTYAYIDSIVGDPPDTFWREPAPSNVEPYIAIPNTYHWSFDEMRGVGLRDYEGYPFGYWGNRNAGWYSSNPTRHRLNSSAPQAPYWNQAYDTTFDYLAHSLIPEIKLIAPKLMELDWINGYSLNSTCPEWRSPCPHYYMEDVWGVDYMDVAFFDHRHEPVGVEYFMMVNREGIADMTNRNVGVALDANHWPEEDTLIVTDIANPDNPRKLKRVGERFTFTEVFEPGEGKLYRVAPVNEAPIAGVPSTDGGVR